MKAITVKFYEDDFERARQLCAEKRCSFGYIIREALRMYLDSISNS